MLLVDVFLVLLGACVAIFGIVLWKKQKVNWVSINAYVKKKDAADFTRLNGIATIGFGIALACPGLFDLLSLRIFGWILFAIFFVAGMTVFFIAQHRYNA